MVLPRYLKPKRLNGEYAQLPWQLNLFKANFVWPMEEDSSRAELYIINFFLLVVLLCFVVTVYAELVFLATTGDFSKFTECVATSVVGIEFFIRLIHLAVRRTKMRILMTYFYKHIFIPEDEDEEEHKLCEKILKPSGVLCASFFLPLILFLALPIIATISDPHSKTKPYFYPMVFPYDAQEPTAYAFTSLYTGWCGFACVSIMGAEDFLITLVLGYAAGRYRMLQKELDNLYPNSVRAAKEESIFGLSTKEKIRINFERGLKEIIKKQQIVDGCAELIEDFFTVPFFIILTCGTFLLCFVAFQLSTYGIQTETLKYTTWLVSSTFELFLLGRIGQRYSDASENLNIKYYMSNWENLLASGTEQSNKAIMKNLIFAIYRSQKPVELTALKFINLSLGTFQSAVSTSISYFMFLNAIKE